MPYTISMTIQNISSISRKAQQVHVRTLVFGTDIKTTLQLPIDNEILIISHKGSSCSAVCSSCCICADTAGAASDVAAPRSHAHTRLDAPLNGPRPVTCKSAQLGKARHLSLNTFIIQATRTKKKVEIVLYGYLLQVVYAQMVELCVGLPVREAERERQVQRVSLQRRRRATRARHAHRADAANNNDDFRVHDGSHFMHEGSVERRQLQYFATALQQRAANVDEDHVHHLVAVLGQSVDHTAGEHDLVYSYMRGLNQEIPVGFHERWVAAHDLGDAGGLPQHQRQVQLQLLPQQRVQGQRHCRRQRQYFIMCELNARIDE
uniref:SFRICE_006595 n=1 Tax=Spodoptera frugiperda TaxID=7108 RepID=A0A2H1VI97_SPOFR